MLLTKIYLLLVDALLWRINCVCRRLTLNFCFVSISFAQLLLVLFSWVGVLDSASWTRSTNERSALLDGALSSYSGSQNEIWALFPRAQMLPLNSNHCKNQTDNCQINKNAKVTAEVNHYFLQRIKLKCPWMSCLVLISRSGYFPGHLWSLGRTLYILYFLSFYTNPDVECSSVELVTAVYLTNNTFAGSSPQLCIGVKYCTGYWLN